MTDATPGTDRAEWSRQHWGGIFGLVYSVCWLAAALMTAIGVDFEINRTPTLLHVVAAGDHRDIFIAANIIGAFGQLALPGFLVGLADHVDLRRPTAAMGIVFWFVAAILTVISCGFHIVFAHLPVHVVQEGGTITPSLLRDANVLHHLGDFFYFAGVLAIVFALIALLPALRDSGPYGRAIHIVGWISVVAALLQFGWLANVDPLQDLGIIGIVGQIAVVVMLSWQMLDFTRSKPAPVSA
jgi:hypothetical protein